MLHSFDVHFKAFLDMFSPGTWKIIGLAGGALISAVARLMNRYCAKKAKEYESRHKANVNK